MKITKIEIENLNSLKGKWTIDLTHPDYKKNHDLFVICGETGAGKTTILDAITLALYAKTPRQKSIGTSENEIMTKETASCLARVTYECKKGHYVSEFLQKRAHGKVNGSLQACNCSITNLDTGKTQSYPPTKFQEATTDIIQLDYEQFCRSILLAQGQFDEFIKGEPKTKAQILAKLNGTEHYKDFAHNLWMRANKINNDFDAERAKLTQIELIGPEELKEIQLQIESDNQHSEELKQVIEKLNKALTWLEKCDEYKAAVDKAQKDRMACEYELEQFSKKQNQLEKAEKAQSCKPSYVLFKDQRTKIKTLKNQIEQEQTALAELELKQQNAKAGLLKSEKAYNLELEKEAKNDELWNEVNKLDVQIEGAIKNEEAACHRKNTEKEKVDKVQNEVIPLKEEADAFKIDCEKLQAYLKEYKADEKLATLIPALEEKQKNLEECEKEISNCKVEKEKLEEELCNCKLNEAQLDKDFTVFDEELKNFVNTEYVSVAAILRASLEEGKPCPVCGSLNHSLCDSKITDDEKTAEVGKKVSELTGKVEEIKLKQEETAAKILEINSKIENVSSALDSFSCKKETLLKEINSQLKPWNIVLNENASSKLAESIESLKTLSEDFIQKEEEYQDKSNRCSANLQRILAYNIDDLLKDFTIAEALYDRGVKDREALQNKRYLLFKEKDVEEEKTKFKENLAQLKQTYEQDKDSLNECDKLASNSKERIETLNKQDCEAQVLFEKYEKEFIAQLKKNDFAEEQDFLDCSFTEEEIKELVVKKEQLTKEDAATKTQCAKAKDDYLKVVAQKVTEKSKDELLKEKEILDAQDKELNQHIGKLKETLEYNNQHQKEFDDQKKKLEKMSKENEIWKQIKDFIGNKDGSTFEQFVEALEFKQLLVIANKYLFGITGNYSLVQKPGQVDFLIHDDNYPDSKDDRSVLNMSGGEKFIISLSLALGIAELASRNVKVDSLFLDEGFGTLSGEPLIEAVNALKSLQNKGKMLGIITHIDAVINEFDQKIEAKKAAGGVSILVGSGIMNEIE